MSQQELPKPEEEGEKNVETNTKDDTVSMIEKSEQITVLEVQNAITQDSAAKLPEAEKITDTEEIPPTATSNIPPTETSTKPPTETTDIPPSEATNIEDASEKVEETAQQIPDAQATGDEMQSHPEEAPKDTEVTTEPSQEVPEETTGSTGKMPGFYEEFQPSSDRGSKTATEEETTSLQHDVESPLTQTSLEDVEPHPLDDLTDQQVIDVVTEVEAENKHLELENILFENFLKENDPSLLEGLDEIMTYLLKKQSYGSSTTQDRISVSMDKPRLRLDSYTSITSIAEGKGPKINLSQKTDMVMRAMEESQSGLESFLKKSHIIKRNLKSELEEFSIREVEIKEATDIFEFNVVTQGYDQLTQRIPAEKFVRYMEEWLKSAQLQIEKLRLRIATLKVQYKKVSQQLIQRQELGENVHAVDFDQLEIENKHFLEKIEQKNVHLIELKKMNGGANLVLSTHKKFLQRQQEDCNKLKEEIELKNSQIEMTEKECGYAEEELNEVYEKFEHCKNLKSQYTVPDIMEYVRLKGKLYELRKNIKVWSRRRKIQEIALNTCLREMKNLTGSTNIDLAWFDDTPSLNSEDSSSSADMIQYK